MFIKKISNFLTITFNYMFGILRTLLAIYVVLLHIFSVPTLGNYAVTFFFVLSGFLMTYIMHNTYGYSSSGYRLFWMNRILRLYPIYLIILGLTIFIVVFTHGVDDKLNPSIYIPEKLVDWVQNITMLYFDIVPHKVKPRLVPTSWALTNELVFYFLISIGISKTFLRTLIWLFISVLYFVFTYYFYDIATYRYSAIPASSLPFALGAILFWIQNRYVNRIETISRKILISFVLLLFLAFNLNALILSQIVYFNEFSKYLNFLFALFIILFLFNFKTSEKKRKIDNFIGMFSYPIYLCHYLVIFIYLNITSFGSINGGFKLSLEALIPFFALLFVFCYPFIILDKYINRIKLKLKNDD